MKKKDQDYAKMRAELLRAVGHICRRCADPRVPREQLNFERPDLCGCRCEKTAGIMEAVEGLKFPVRRG